VILDILALAVSVASAGFAGWSIIYARRSARSAGSSAQSAALTAGIDSDRRHAELTPRFHITVQGPFKGNDCLKLVIGLDGPPELERLDELIVAIRDDHPWRANSPSLGGGPTPEEIAAQIWGAWRFRPGTGPGADSVKGIPGADPTGRTTPTSGLPVGEELPFFLEPNHPPTWSDSTLEVWQAQVGLQLRLKLTCRRDGHDPWVLTAELVFDGLGVATTEIPRALT
jgi:hypothetical protein